MGDLLDRIIEDNTTMALSKKTVREMFWMMLLARRLPEWARVLHRQGKIPFHK